MTDTDAKGIRELLEKPGLLDDQLAALAEAVEREISRRIELLMQDAMLFVGVLAARHPEGVLVTVEEIERVRAGKLARHESVGGTAVVFEFIPATAKDDG